MQKNSIQAQYFPIEAIRRSPDAARRHGASQQRKLARSLERFGQVVPILVDGELSIIDGHAVCEALAAQGAKEVWAVVVSHLTSPEVRALRLVLNRLSEDARWDRKALEREFSALFAAGVELDLTGFDVPEIDNLLEIDVPKTDVVKSTDEIPYRPDAPISKLGDIWQCGPHRVGCSDALTGAALDSLLAGESADMAFFDPSHNVRREPFVSLDRGQHGAFIQVSGEKSLGQFDSFLTGAIRSLRSHIKDGAIAFLCMDWRHYATLAAAAEIAGFCQIDLCVWTNANTGMGLLYRCQHELVLVFRAGSAHHQSHIELGRHGRSRSNVWAYRGMNSLSAERDPLLAAHPPVKPVAMIADAIRDVTRRKDLVLDTFLGSGSTSIAAEETGRRCFGLDLDPGYVDVAVRRWQAATGRDAVDARTGTRFNEVQPPSPEVAAHE